MTDEEERILCSHGPPDATEWARLFVQRAEEGRELGIDIATDLDAMRGWFLNAFERASNAKVEEIARSIPAEVIHSRKVQDDSFYQNRVLMRFGDSDV